MELDDLKSAWAQYDKKLSRTLKLNEQMLRKINLANAQRELQKPLRYEQFGVLSMVIMVVALIVITVRNGSDLKYLLPGIFSIAFSALYLGFALVKTNAFMNIDHYADSIVKLQRDITKVNQLVLRLRYYELLLTPLIVISFPVIFKGLYNTDMYEHPTKFLILAGMCLMFGIPTVLWVNKHVYDKKFQNATRFLKEIDAFEHDVK